MILWLFTSLFYVCSSYACMKTDVTHMPIYIHVYMHVHVCIYSNVYTHTCFNVYMYIHTYMYIYVHTTDQPVYMIVQ